MSESLVDKACRYFREGRILVEERTRDGRATVTVRGRLGVYRVVHEEGRWRCNCPASVDRCAHVIGAALACDPAGTAIAGGSEEGAARRGRDDRVRRSRAVDDLRVRDVREGESFRFVSSPAVRVLAAKEDLGGDGFLLTFVDGTRLDVRGGQRVVLARAPASSA